MRATMRERTFRSRLVSQTLASTPARVLDLGTGTGSLAVALNDAGPNLRVTGLDGDPGALVLARAKDPEDQIEWIHGRASELPFPSASFDAVTCSLMLHHLQDADKLAALRECLRVLVPGGHLLIADWGAASDPLMWLAFCVIRLLDGFARTRAHAAGALPKLIQTAGFGDVRSTAKLRTCWGTLQLISALAVEPAANAGSSL
ncbi:MAG: class I SAM-dependent methyltransferase [Solirubrobacteraceae bacterium]